MTTYLAAYDVEHADCLAALRSIVRVHEKYDMPGTCFVVARLLEKQGGEYRALLGDHPLFELASHSYTHALLRNHPVCGSPRPDLDAAREIVDSKRRIEDTFGRAVTGFRTPVGFEDGLCGAPELLALCSRAGYRYTSCLLWGPGCTLPAPIREPFTHADQGFPDLWEVPGCGWHDNVLKRGNSGLDPVPLQPSPHPYPETALDGYVETPEAEAELNGKFIDRAVRMDTSHVTPIWHPWSLNKFDPAMTMLDGVFGNVRERGLPAATFAQYVETLGKE